MLRPLPRRPLTSGIFAALALLLLAGIAKAEEIYLVVEKTAASGEPARVAIRSDAKGEVLLTAWWIANPAALLDRRLPLDRGEALADLVVENRIKDPRLTGGAGVTDRAIVTKSVRYETPGARKEYDLGLLKPGLYLVRATLGRQSAMATVLVSDLALVTKRFPGGILAWTVHRTTGLPRAGVRVGAWADDRETAAGTTDASGMLRLSGDFPPTVALRAVDGENLAFGEDTYFPADVADRRVYAFPNQPAYRPGERVEVKGVVRAVSEGRYVLDPTAVEATLRFVGPGEKEMGRVTAPVSRDLGTFSGGFALPDDAPTGPWVLVAEFGTHSYEAPFVVDAYRKPAFEVTVTPKDARVLSGQGTTFDVSAAFFDGGIVANAPVHWELVYGRVDRELFPTDELVRLFFGTEREAYAPETLLVGDGVLDAKGTLVVEGLAPVGKPDGYLTLRATVTGPDRMAVVGSGGVAVAASPVRVDLKTDRHLYGPEDVARVTVKVERADGAPATGRKGLLSVGIERERGPGQPVEEEVTQRLPFEADASGTARLDVALGMNGRYVLAAAVERLPSEPAGPPAHASLHVWAVGEQSTLGYAGDRLEVVADKDDYAVGETARILVLTPAGSRPMLASLEGATLLDARLLTPKGNAALWTVALVEDHVPNVFAGFLAVDHGNLLTGTKMLRIPPATRLLKTTIVADAADLDPGAKSGVTVTVTDSSGKPVAGAEVSVAVVDDALHALYPDPAAPIEAFFYPARRNSVRTGGPLQHGSVGFAMVAPKEMKAGNPTLGAVPEAAAGEEPAPSPTTLPRASPVGPPPPQPPASPAMDPAEGGAGASCGAARDDEGCLQNRDNTLYVSPDGKRNGASPASAARADFRTSVFWTPLLRTDAEGRARIDEVKYAESLTRWRITARTVDAGTRVGSAASTVRTRKNVSVDVILPRFLRVTDAVKAPVLLRNLTKEDVMIGWGMGWRDLDVRGAAFASNMQSTNEDQPLAAGVTRIETLPYEAERQGTVEVTAEVTSAVGNDAVKRTIPVHPQGIEKVVGRTTVSQGRKASLSIEVPEHAEKGTIDCRVSVEPGVVQAIVAALPYVIDYPYGCTEQTMSRFGPVLSATEAVKALGIPPQGAVAELPKMIAAGLDRLSALQHQDGGFGWWPNDATTLEMTAIVARGLTRAIPHLADPSRAVQIREGALARLAQMVEALSSDDAAAHALALLALAEAKRLPEGALVRALDTRQAYAASPITRALFLEAAMAAGDARLVHDLRQELEAGAIRDEGTAHWGGPTAEGGEGPTRWQEDAVEATAEVGTALLNAGGDPALLRQAVVWLLVNRAGGDHWHSTRDTAAAVWFLAAYAATPGSPNVDLVVELSANGQHVASAKINRETLFTNVSILQVPAEILEPGAVIRLDLEADAGDYVASAALEFFETGPAIRAASSGFTVSRRWFRLDPVEQGGKVTWRRTEVTETVASGTLLESEVTVETAKPRDYVMVVDPSAASFEPFRETAMDVPGRGPAAEAETQRYDDRTVFFLARLPAGTTVFRHTVRATHVGHFTALPAQASLMYFPDVRGNSDGEVLEVTAPAPKEGGGK